VFTARCEYAILERLHHPNIVQLFEYTEDDDKIVAYMEYCNDPGHLEVQIYERKKEIKDESLLRSVAKQILTSIAFIHQMGVIHADLKLPNLLSHRSGSETDFTVKLCDFGIAMMAQPKQFNGEKKGTMKVRSGTSGYIAPEVKGQDIVVGPEIDMWAFGVILYELCVAYKPTQVKEYRYRDGPIPFRERDWKKLTNKGADVQDLIVKCL